MITGNKISIRLASCLAVFILMLMITGNVQAQTTVGVMEPPVNGALLQIKNIAGVTDGSVNATKGLCFPRVALVKGNQLQPMYSEADAAALSADQRQVHRGLIVYNINEIVTEGLTVGLNIWDGEKWVGFREGTSNAIFDITDCSTVKIAGEYSNAVPLNTSNYVKMTINVTKKGSYTITATPDPDNGYYFSTSGEFLTTGTVEIMIQGVGQPVNFTPAGQNGDHLILSLNGTESTCNNLYIKVEDSSTKPLYAMTCNSVTVKGVYKKGIAVTANEKITLRINVYEKAQGTTWHASTELIDGLKFEGSGILGGAGPQEIELYAEGAPLSTASKLFTITTNSQATTATCKALVTPVISSKKIIAVGSNIYGLTSGGQWGCDAMIKNTMNFGNNENSIVKYEGFTQVTTAANLINLSQWVGSNPYDIIVITYNITPNATQNTMLVDYVNRGGVLIYLDQNANANNVGMVGAVFGETITNAVSIGSNCNNVIRMNQAIDDEISNGPFGDVRNSQWGEDYANSCGLPVVPRGAIVYAQAVNASTGLSPSTAQASMLRHPTKNFFWCGDSGLIHAESQNDTSNDTAPFKVGARVLNGVSYPKYPLDKPNYGTQASANRLPVCNSTIFANVMAWAIRMAEENGINSGQ